MADRIETNKGILRGMYEGNSDVRAVFVCNPPVTPLFEERGDYTLSSEPVEHWLPLVVENYGRQVSHTGQLGDCNVPTASLGTCTHLFAQAFGSPVHVYENNCAAAQPLVKTAAEADALEEPDIWKSPGLSRVFELGRIVQKELGKDVPLGPPDIQSGFDTACLIWEKAELFCAMIDPQETDAVHRLVAKCAGLLKTFLGELRREFPTLVPSHCPRIWAPPEMGVWLSNDECGSFSTGMFEEFCLPELIDLSETFGGLGMHCCADAEHQFESFKRIPNFYAFNRVAAKRGYEPLLEHFDGPDAPVHVLSCLSEEEIRNLLAKASPSTRFIFVCELDVDEGKEWLEKMRSL